MPPLQNDGLVALTLGQVEFTQFEIPEHIDHFCGTQKLVVHEFPGGQRTVQKMGPFPPRTIRWQGIFWQGDTGDNAQDRVDQLNQMRVAGDTVELAFGPYSYDVIIHEFLTVPGSIFRQPYALELVPVRDNTASSRPQLGAPPNSGATQLAQQNAQLAGANNVFAELSNTPATQAALNQMNQFQQQLGNALQSATGANASNINTTSLTSSLQQSQSLVGPLGNSTNSGLAASALQSSAILGNINNTLAAGTPILTVLTCVNPNLKALSVQYYGGDQSKWTVIATANKLSVPRPIGIFSGDTALIIPKLAS